VPKVYHPPTKFCVFPAMTYCCVDGRPVSSLEFNEATEANRLSKQLLARGYVKVSKEAQRLLSLFVKYKRLMNIGKSKAKKKAALHKYRKYLAQFKAYMRWVEENDKPLLLVDKVSDLPSKSLPHWQVCYKETEVARELHLHTGWIEEVPDVEEVREYAVPPWLTKTN